MTDELYFKAVIIANGIPDSDDDILGSEDIMELYKKYNNRPSNFEINHDGIYRNGVELIDSYISTEAEKIGMETIPTGSWIALIKSTNKEINKLILDNKLTGVSLTNRISDSCPLKAKKKHDEYDYKDTDVKECIYPTGISLVVLPRTPSNGFGLNVADDYGKIIKTRKVNKVSLIEDLRKLINSYSEEAKEDATVEEEVEIIEEAVEEAEAVESKKEEEPEKVEKEKEVTEETTEEAPKAEETEEKDYDKIIADLTARIEALEAQLAEKEEAPKIVKKTKKVIEAKKTEPVQKANYFDLSGRDPITGLRK